VKVPTVTPSPPGGPAPPQASGSNLAQRVVSSLVLAPVAIAVAWFGGPLFVAFWAIAALVVLWEWISIVGKAAAVRWTWLAAGVLYAGALLAAPLVLRADPALGFWAIIFLFAIVWASDIGAYFAGRALGGAKLWPAVSPKKTWSGAVGGTVTAILAGLVVARLVGLPLAGVVVVALVLSIVSQLGDLLESAVKRRFGAKDASALIPGHGGLMDRLDGFLTAALAAAMVGLIRGGLSAPAQGLLVW
jgi:phosphatidate cytidylyltransferase